MKENLIENIIVDKICEFNNYIKIYSSLTLYGEKLCCTFTLSKKYKLDNFAKDIAKLNLLIKFREKLNLTNDELTNLTQKLFQKLPAKKFEMVKCYNTETTLNSETKVLLLGSITSISGMKNGYFYTSDTNQAMRLLDKVLQSNNKKPIFESIKQELIFARKNNQDLPTIVKKLKANLVSEKIAFLDVIECCIRPVNSSLDNDIIISVPFSSSKFYDLIKSSNVKAIFTNSKFVEEYYKQHINCNEVFSELNIKYDKIMSPSPAYLKKFDIKAKDWCDKISKFLK